MSWRDVHPTRVTVNSNELIKILTSIAGCDYSRNTIMRPFKALLEHETAIRNAYRKLETDCEDERIWLDAEPERSGRSHPANGPTSLGPTQHLDDVSIRRLHEKNCQGKDLLRCMIEFMDKDMQSIFELRRQVAAKSLDTESIAHENLWHLFKPGDLVILNKSIEPGPQRALCILHVTGGRPLSAWSYNLPQMIPGHESPISTGLSSKTSTLVLDCFYIDYNGVKFGPRPMRLLLQEYNGLTLIASLDVIPLKLMAESDTALTSLIKRGEIFTSLCPSRHKTYRGSTLEEITDAHVNQYPRLPGCHGSAKEQINSEIVLDQKAGIEHYERLLSSHYKMKFGGDILEKPTGSNMRETWEVVSCLHRIPCSGCSDIAYDAEFDNNARTVFIQATDLLRTITLDEMKKGHYALLTPRMYGYALQERKWHALNIELVTDHKTTSNTLQSAHAAFDNLVLPKEHKELLQALVKNQTRQFQTASAMWLTEDRSRPTDTADVSMDLIRGKGKGLIILLHGAPGVGKTSTAECIAAQLQRPLFPITCGDLGTDANTVETRLAEYFSLAQRWGCVLLLDEADVFLAQRSSDQLKRNALVSVFLRVLEYYAGVLMLTTNRVGEFDEAFRSRIHISLYYPKLDRRTTTEIWDMNVRRLQNAKDVDLEIDEEGIRSFYRQHWDDTTNHKGRRWNRRQIKNAFQTALALANWEFHDGPSNTGLTKPHLKKEHFKTVAKTSNHFDDYIADLLREGGDPHEDVRSLRAKREGLRDDRNPGASYVETSRRQQSRSPRRHKKREDRESDDPETENLRLRFKVAELEMKANKVSAKKEKRWKSDDEDDSM
ncbi:P-loop containing nucleoside triphosphate hydrolase protein [Pleomassaria siparia CBS 279.74]|uniref:P-loop containing nucleoside triphosphate hydrolase protein n=1 Tax=Pleomassaria siparia CBS 279.74 TaxID=1314801 RepID=A0A6G1JX72_9PLEO|nr:P-loop containing nucleoside triphosphate hydrolase protein [Pleomassaria siparia CBS 279.74]